MALKDGEHPARKKGELLVVLAGNPNVGKSTVFNALTGMRQHTGNWAGKTVANAFGRYEKGDTRWLVADLPGCCSLNASKAEECAARDFICLEHPDVVVVVCSAVSLERSLILALQTLEITCRVVVCVNLLDEAKRKGIEPELDLLEKRLGVPVVGTSARSGKGLDKLVEAVKVAAGQPDSIGKRLIRYSAAVEGAAARLLPDARKICPPGSSPEWIALHSLDGQPEKVMNEESVLFGSRLDREMFARRRQECIQSLERQGIGTQELSDCFAQAAGNSSHEICCGIVPPAEKGYNSRDRMLDRVLTGRYSGLMVMLLLLALVMWITLEGANYISGYLSMAFNHTEDILMQIADAMRIPDFWRGLIVSGAFRVLGWVVAVMLPPMAIFFPLFTLLEDAGYLPRVAFNLDGMFSRCGACGKQALTMCMGLGCNAAGVVGCRIIASPRERLIAILTNSFVPCNGRFPTMLTVITLFLAGTAGNLASAAVLTGFVLLGVVFTMIMSRLLSVTVLRGQKSSFSLELPHFRRPMVMQTLVRSLLDRTLAVLGRAAVVAVPAGGIIWLLANITSGGETLLQHVTGFLDPVGQLMGLDGVILTAFILGFPANELVLPVAVMAYEAQGELMEIGSMQSIGAVLAANGWDWITAVSVLLFTLMHWPCSTTCITIYKETGSVGWAVLGFILPTVCGFLCCSGFTLVMRLVSG